MNKSQLRNHRSRVEIISLALAAATAAAAALELVEFHHDWDRMQQEREKIDSNLRELGAGKRALECECISASKLTRETASEIFADNYLLYANLVSEKRVRKWRNVCLLTRESDSVHLT